MKTAANWGGNVPQGVLQEARQRKKPSLKRKDARFDTLVDRYYPAVYSFACRLADDPREAVLLTHRAFISTRKQLQSGRNEVEIGTMLLIAMIRAAGIVKPEGPNQTARLHADEPITASNRAGRQACSRRCPICLAAGRTYRGELDRRGDDGQSSTFSRVG